MAQTPSVDDLVARIAELEKRLAENERKTLSTIAVTAANSVRMLNIAPDTAHSNRPKATIRDSNGNALLENDTAAGWGFATPIINYPFYPYDGRFGFKTSVVGTYDGIGYTGVNLLSKKVAYAIYVSWDSGVTSCNVKLTYAKLGDLTDTLIQEQTFTGSSGQYLQGTFLMPTDVFTSSTSFYIYGKVNTGSGNVGAVPSYFQTRGVNV